MKKLYYQDLILLANQEVSTNFLMSKVISVLHLVLVEDEHNTGSVNIGIAFPRYSKEKRTLGRIVRLFAYHPDILSNLSSEARLSRLDDYIQKGEILPVPDTVQEFVQYQRVQFKENKERLVRRYAQRHQIDINQARKKYSSYINPVNNIPYVTLNSHSTSQRFNLYVDEVLQDKNTESLGFNSYGLTKFGALPYFIAPIHNGG
jgi:CRISPR-associated endonuclease Csy4